MDNRFQRWGKLCGVYFRFPTEDMDNLYCDDDYDGSMQFSTWLRRQYTGPYEYNIRCEGFSQCYKEVLDFYKYFPVINGHPPKTHSPKNATHDEVFRSIFFESAPTELLERLRLHYLLFLTPPPPDYALPDRQTPLPVTTELWYYFDYRDIASHWWKTALWP